MSHGLAGEHQWYAGIPRSTRSATLFGIAILGSTVMGFGVWASTALIAGAIVTTGAFVATGQNKIIQHLEGGVIREIAVREGDIVEPDQTLIHLDETAPNVELRRLELRLIRSRAMDARLQAEMREQAELSFPPDILAQADDPDVAANLDAQRLTFEARRNNLQSEVATIREGINALQERVDGTKVQMAGVHNQIKLIEEELVDKNILLKSGLVRKPEVLALQRTHANLKGEVGRLTGEIGDARERIARSWEQIAGVRKTAVKTAVEQLHEVRAEFNDLRERIRTAKRTLDRIKVTAPVKGVVVKLRYHTPGGVIEAGKPIMEILPVQEELIIEARVRPQDIDNVKRGQQAMIRLTALNQRVTPMISGEVVYVSADAMVDDKNRSQSSTDIYVARVKLNAAEVAGLKGFTPTPGMPAEVYIKTAERTFFEYLMKPIEDSMSRAFREY